MSKKEIGNFEAQRKWDQDNECIKVLIIQEIKIIIQIVL
ncbi:unnamed protein product [Paramecium octaurelia]|uniref:Uncharacterized protein n=1 Tax=Paramecium octaurelia TaxID=43137 RepID=A0A8S1V9D3_PAROT|nr:unnamed protein product [Paramecium octaurelia]